jgi:membrane protein
VKERLLKRIVSIYRRLNTLTRGALDVLVCAIDRFNGGRGSQAAASMAYYFMFSLFPLLLLLISIGSIVLSRHDVQQMVTDVIAGAIPNSQEVVLDNIELVLAARGTVTIISAISLLWSASGMFSALSYSVNLMWPDADWGSFLKQRLAGLAFVGLLFVILVAATIASSLFNLAIQLGKEQGMDRVVDLSSTLWWIVSVLGPWILKFLVFFILYRWIPTASVKARAAVIGAILATVGWDLTTTVFAWFLSSGLINYSVIYGSLGAIVGLLFWMYLGSMVIFLGAAVTSAIDEPPEQPLSSQSPEALGSFF